MNSLCLDVVNSRWFLTHKPFYDPMDNRDWLTETGDRYHLPEICLLDSRDELKDFREFLFSVLLDLCAGHHMEPSSIAKINQILASNPSQDVLVLECGEYRMKVRHDSDPVTWVLYQIALSFTKLITEYPLTYLKKCENPRCDWIFYDDSKSHTRKWCDNRCASLMKVRNYRARKK